MPRVQHPSTRNGTSAPALPVALRDGDFFGPTARLWRAGGSCDRWTSPHASPCGRSILFCQSRRNGATAFGTSPSAAPVGLRLRVAGAGTFFCGGVAQSVERPVVNRSVAGSNPALAANPEAVGSPAGSALQSEQAEMGRDASTERNDSLAAHPRCRDSRRDGAIHSGVEQLVARRPHKPKVAGSTPAPATSPRSGPLLREQHGFDAGAYDHRRSCPRPAGRTISKQPCDWRGLSAAGEQGGATATAAPTIFLARSADPAPEQGGRGRRRACAALCAVAAAPQHLGYVHRDGLNSMCGSRQPHTGTSSETARRDACAPGRAEGRCDVPNYTRAPRPLTLLLPVAAPAASGGACASFSLRGVA